MTQQVPLHSFLRIIIRFLVAVFAISPFLTSGPAWAADGASVARGGRLFDNWFLETRDRPPLEIHPEYQYTQPSMHVAETSWRYSSCHGWDYMGRADQETGVLGNEAVVTPASLERILQNENHGYGILLSKRDYADLAAFISDGLVDMTPFVGLNPIRFLGDVSKEAPLYATICANCHGEDGHEITTVAPLGTFIRLHPQEALHKIINGHPAERMPPLRFLEIKRLGDLLAYASTLPGRDLSASIARGGRLYDNWQEETKAPSPISRHPAYPRDATYAESPEVNWRCKECHGWDYKGRDGAYGRGHHYTGAKGIDEMAGAEPADVVRLLMDANHLYHGTRWFDGPLDFQDLLDLANFVTRGQIDMDAFIDRETGIAKGDPLRRRNEFDILCATCHGVEGDALATGYDVGQVARSNPWEVLHKIRNGHPDEAMPALHILDMSVIVDILAYAQTLPD